MRRIALLALVMVAAACGTDPGPANPAGAGGEAGQGAMHAGGSGGAGGGQGGTLLHPGVLVDEGLVARYYLDEAERGQAPTEALDAAADPLPLTVTYANDQVTSEQFMDYAQDVSGNRGLSYSTVAKDDTVAVDIDGTKILQMIHGGKTTTYEVVADIHEVTTDTSRLIAIGVGADHQLSFEASAPYHLALDVNSLGPNRAAVYWPAFGRAVYHAVLDTSRALAEERVRMYVNGDLHPTLVTADALVQDTPVDLGTGRSLVIGNRLTGGRSLAGTIYYAAVYNIAMTAEQVEQNVELLIVDDDTPE